MEQTADNHRTIPNSADGKILRLPRTGWLEENGTHHRSKALLSARGMFLRLTGDIRYRLPVRPKWVTGEFPASLPTGYSRWCCQHRNLNFPDPPVLKPSDLRGRTPAAVKAA